MSRRRYYDDDYYGRYYPRSRPREVKGGIKAQSKRGEFGTSWWAKRWLDVLNSFQIGARLARAVVRPRRAGPLDRRREGAGPGQGPGVSPPAL